jgi:hypothetical protein
LKLVLGQYQVEGALMIVALVLKYRLKFQVVVLAAMELLVPAHLPVKNQEAEVAMEGPGLPESGLELVVPVQV